MYSICCAKETSANMKLRKLAEGEQHKNKQRNKKKIPTNKKKIKITFNPILYCAFLVAVIFLGFKWAFDFCLTRFSFYFVYVHFSFIYFFIFLFLLVGLEIWLCIAVTVVVKIVFFFRRIEWKIMNFDHGKTSFIYIFIQKPTNGDETSAYYYYYCNLIVVVGKVTQRTVNR